MKLIVFAGLVIAGVLWWIAREADGFEARPDRPRQAAARSPGVERPAPAPRLAVAPPAAPRPPPAFELSGDPAPSDAADSDPGAVAAMRRTRLQAHFANQPVDPGWASTAQYALQDELGRLSGDGIRIQRVECRSSLCRVEISVPGREAGVGFLESWLHQRTWAGPGFASSDETDPGHAPRMILFLGRPGTELPTSG